MTTPDVLQLLVTQTWQVTAIALAVWLVARIIAKNQPQMAHLLWAIVLLKVLAPPVWSSPVGVFSWLERTYSATFPAAKKTQEPSRGDFLPALQPLSEDTQLFIGPSAAQRDRNASLAASEQPRLVAGRQSHWLTRNWQPWLVALWLGGAAASLLIAVVRLLSFAGWVASHAQHSAASSESAEQLAERLARLLERVALKLRVRRPVAIRIVQAPIGPVVFGWWRPTIVLSAVVLRDRSDAEVEPLLAHELVHIRRGDLWWAGVQTLATSLFWFHPLVWFASRMLTRESERSCDEQTIAGLGCSAATYARGLLDVLERKNQLRVAPALPGVRPVDITRSRLERIMRLGQGSRRTTPAWAWCVFSVCAAMLFPGGAWLSAQESAPADAPEQLAAPAPMPAPVPVPVPQAAGPWPDRIERASFEVGDLLEQLEETGNTREQAEVMLLSFVPRRTLEQVNEEAAQYDAKMSGFPAPAIEGSTLQLMETHEQIAFVESQLERLRKYGFRQVAVQVYFISLSKDRMEKLGIDWQQALPWERHESNPRDGGVVLAASMKGERPLQFFSGSPTQVKTLQVPVTPMPTFSAVLEREQAARLIDRVQSDARSNILQAPRITLFNGVEATIVDVVQRPFLTGIGFVLADDHGRRGKLHFIELAETGTKLRLAPVIKEGRAIELSVALTYSFLRDVQTFTFDRSKNADGTVVKGKTIQIPDMVSKGLSVQAEIQPGQTLAFTSGVPFDSRKDTVEIALATAFEVDFDEPTQAVPGAPAP
jgi:beta-lactamase regulating signal transducer with metallopeptidase domain